jgi:transcriptional regulator with XRE-family HTH domain
MTPSLQRVLLKCGMTKKPLFRRTYIRKWREKANLSLRALANRMEEEPGGDLIISHVSIGRIERGEQPYTQPVIEALADALGLSVATLLEVNPDIEDSRVIDITSRLRMATPAERDQAIRVLDAVLPRTTRAS